MKKIIMVATLTLSLFLTGCSLESETSSDSESAYNYDDEISTLLDDNEELNNRVDELEQRVDELESIVLDLQDANDGYYD